MDSSYHGTEHLSTSGMNRLGRLIVVTGTDTGVGKTFGSAVIARYFISLGESVSYYKPAQTGVGVEISGLHCCPVTEESPDIADAITMSTLVPQCAVHEGSRLSEPLSPVMAAEVDSRELLSVAEVGAQCATLLSQCDRVILEGAGGVTVDITRDGSLCEVISAMSTIAEAAGTSVSVVVVTRSSLGTLNHTVLTLDYLIRRTTQNYTRSADAASSARSADAASYGTNTVPYGLLVNVSQYPKPTDRLNLEALRDGLSRFSEPVTWLGEIPHIL